MQNDSQIVIVENPGDDECQSPFGERYGMQKVVLSESHLAAMKSGKAVAVDVLGEYVLYLRFGSEVRGG